MKELYMLNEVVKSDDLLPQVDTIDTPKAKLIKLMMSHHKIMTNILQFNLKELTTGKTVDGQVQIVTYIKLLAEQSIRKRVIEPLKGWVKEWDKILKTDKNDEFAQKCKDGHQCTIDILTHLLEVITRLDGKVYTLIDQVTIDTIIDLISDAITSLEVKELAKEA